MARAPHDHSDAIARKVESFSSIGIPQLDIAKLIGLSKTTLRKYYRSELELGELKANASIAGALYKAAMLGNTTSQIFWLKTRAKWRETDPPLPPSDSSALLKQIAAALPD